MSTHNVRGPGVLVALVSLALGACPTSSPPPDTGPSVPDATLADANVVDAGHDAASTPRDANVDVGHDAYGPDSGIPVFRHPVSTPDAQLAHDALQILGSINAGATSPYCRDCHTLSRERLHYWRALSDQALSPAGCLNDLTVSSDASAHAMVECIRASGEFTTPPVGVFATAYALPWFQYVFQHGEGAGAMTAHDAFVTHAGMPQVSSGYAPMTQEQFDIVAEWFIRGVPQIDSVLGPDATPMDCLPGVSASVATHLASIATTNWSAVDHASGTMSFGCAGASSPAECLATVPLASTTAYGASWENVSNGVPGAHLRVLYTTNYETSWWTRASVDGRFVSHGAPLTPQLRFIDLESGTVIGGAGMYDTSWFPDASGFVIQTGTGAGARVCVQSVLTAHAPTMLTFTESGCSAGTGIGLYEHVGTSLGGGDYWAPAGTATYDNGGHVPTLSDPIADWDSSAHSTFTHLLNTGTSFAAGAQHTMAHPYEGDAVISPSATAMLTRVGGAGSVQHGYLLRSLDTSSGTPVSTEIGRYCFSGAKPEFSYDERYFVFHHYIGAADAVELGFTGPSDPAFAPFLTQGGANSYLVDTTTGARYRLTNVSPGQYALFPHFRADGWIYMMVRTIRSSPSAVMPEYVVASDAALLH